MGLLANRDFQSWLEHFAERHEQLHGDGPQSPEGLCDGCGDALPAPPSPTPFCIVCLAEQYGRDRSRSSARIAHALRVALAREPGLPAGDVREAIEEVMEELEPVA
jgi:hypothetical protein